MKPRLGQIPLSSFLLIIVLKFLARAIRKDKEINANK
jgi:hypothetical protein